MEDLLFKINDEIAVTNTAKVTAAEDTVGKTGTATVTENKEVSLSITKDANPSVVTSGVQTPVTFLITATNGGPSKATGVVISDTIPAEFSIVSATSPAGTPTVVGQTVTLSGISINKNGSVTVTINTNYIG